MIEIQKLEQKEINKGFKARFVHTQNNTLAFWEIEKGACLPLHSHIHEQVTQVLEGELELTVNGITTIYTAGQLVVIPSNVEHQGNALTNCKVLDIFAPVRKDFL